METLDPSRLHRRVLAGARCILAASGVERVDPDHYRVAGARPGAEPVRVYRRGGTWRCSSDRRHHAAQPCAHILAVLEVVGAVRLPATVSPIAESARRDALEAEAARLLPERLPGVLARMLDASPAAAPQAPGKGRPRCSPIAVAHQAVMRAATRGTLKSAGAYAPVSRATVRRFLAEGKTDALLRAMKDWTLAAARPQDATRPDALNRGALAFSTPLGPLLFLASWTPTYGLLARLDPMPSEPVIEAPGAEEAARRFTALLGAELVSRDPAALANEALCAALAWNLARLVVVDLERGGTA
ncbi:MAG: hypothetical protein QOD77_1666 [Thermoplasmata archaeon]|jgi:hypothetical protein|nr:hypothetical protein [Thermoplasmata archaeon]